VEKPHVDVDRKVVAVSERQRVTVEHVMRPHPYADRLLRKVAA